MAVGSTVPTCSPRGDQDIYGIGIRVGLYLQWYARCLAEFEGLHYEVDQINFTNALFLTALIINLFKKDSPDPEPGRLVEVFLVSLFAVGIFGAYILLAWPLLSYRVAKHILARVKSPKGKEEPFSLALAVGIGEFRIFLFSFCLGLYLTMCFGAAVRSYLKPPNACQDVAFFCARINLRDIWVGVVFCLFAGGHLLYGLFVLYPVVFPAKVKILDHEQSHYGHLENFALRYRSVVSLIVSTYLVLAAELTIYWNNFEGINGLESSGQTIPLIIGVGTISKVIFEDIKMRVKAGKLMNSREVKSNLQKLRFMSSSTSQHLTPVHSRQVWNYFYKHRNSDQSGWSESDASTMAGDPFDGYDSVAVGRRIRTV
ncbi:MAG: hypothetical protein M1814_004632 [Vezdaea aestivalis]|nr:MAG: hypothetical protein M1814_004632 [Vezdaea aestivalis]